MSDVPQRQPGEPTAEARNASATALDLQRNTALREILGLLAHEMRTPLGAIIGYGELLDDGLLGPLPQRATDAVRRMSTAVGQLRHLIDGLSDLMVHDAEVVLEVEEVDFAHIAGELVSSAQALAGGRGVELDVLLPEGLPGFRTDGARLAAAIDLAVGAAIRASPGATLRLAFAPDRGGVAITVEGTGLDSARDLPVDGLDTRVSTGAGLRLMMAARMLGMLGGGARIDGASPSTLVVWATPRSIDEHPRQP